MKKRGGGRQGEKISGVVKIIKRREEGEKKIMEKIQRHRQGRRKKQSGEAHEI